MNEPVDANQLSLDFSKEFWTELGTLPDGTGPVTILSVSYGAPSGAAIDSGAELGVVVTYMSFQGTATTEPTALPTEFKGFKVVYERGEPFELLSEEEGVV